MNKAKKEIIDAEFSIVNDGKAGSIQEKHIWVLVGDNIIDARLAKISMKILISNDKICVDCYVLQIEGVDIKDAFGWRVFECFKEIPTREEQNQMVKGALLKHQLRGEIWMVGERYAEGHKAALKLQSRIKGGAHVSV